MYTQTIAHVRHTLDTVFAELDTVFGLPAAMRSYSPASDVWSIDQILEHITLTSHYLLITISNSCEKCCKRAARGVPIQGTESDLEAIKVIGHPDAFEWLRPEHMEPTGTLTLAEVRKRMHDQHQRCLTILEQLSHGQGALHRVRMSVQDLGKLDVYQWLYFLAQHAQRHGIEIKRLQTLYKQL